MSTIAAGIGGSGDQQRLVGGQAVIDHGGDVDDGDIGGSQLPPELRAVIEHVLGVSVGAIRRGDGGDDAAVRGTVGRIDDTGARMRAVDHPVAPALQQFPHECLAVA